MKTQAESTNARRTLPVTRRAALGLLAAGCLSLAGCGKRWSWHEKITAEVDTPDGVVTGSSVIRRSLTHTDSSFAPPEARGASSGVSGEAAVVEVMPGRYLFVLLKDLPNTFSVFFPGEAPVEMANRLETFREKRDVPRDLYPLLVTFADINDPTTVQRVDPDNLAATFGRGFSLKRITLEITEEKVTEGRVEGLLTWLGQYYDIRLDGQRYGSSEATNRLANSLAAGNFDTRR